MQVNYFVPTRIISGKNSVKNSTQEISALGKSALIVTGGKSAKLCGAQDDVLEVLKENGQKWSIFNEITPNPDRELVQKKAEDVKNSDIDFIIAIGGGSPLDAGKAIAYYASEDAGKYVMPIVAIPTTAGTGSEVTQYAIVTDHEKQTKTSIASDNIFPRLALLDAKYTLTLGKETTINTAVDALSHAIEGMLTVRANPLTDVIASQAIEIINSVLKTDKDISEYTLQDRELLLYASTLAGMVIANTGTTILHAIGYSLTYFYDVDHGKANGLLMAEFLKLYAKQKPDPISKILNLMGFIDIDELDNLMFKLLGKCVQININDVGKYASIAMTTKNIQNTAIDLTQTDLEKIYEETLRGH